MKTVEPIYGACGTHEHEEQDKSDLPNLSTRSTPICTDASVVKYVSINMHFIQTDFGTGNFTEYSDGNGNYNYTGYDRARDMVNHMNNHMSVNYKMQLPCPNNTANLPTRIQYVLKGVYFHRSSSQLNAYGVSTQNNAFGKNKNTEVNIFFAPCPKCHFHQMVNGDSTYVNGVALTVGASTNAGTVLYQDYKAYLDSPNTWDKGAWGTAKLIDHEMGHLFSLHHAWVNNNPPHFGDYCSDTPSHSNCWNVNYPPTSNCATPCQVSNNLMDYNYSQGAITPQQITRIHNHLNGNGNAYVHSCDGCMPTNSFFYLPEIACLASNKTKIFLDGRGSWEVNNYQIEIYRVGNVGSSTQVGNTYHIAAFTGSVGKIDLRTFYNFQLGKIYQVRLITHNSCGSHTSASWVSIAPTTECMIEEEALPFDPTPNIGGKISYLPSIPVAANEILSRQVVNEDDLTTLINNKIDLTLTPNPAQNTVQLSYAIKANSRYQLNLKSVLGGQLEVIEEGVAADELIKTRSFDISQYPSGTYFVELITEKERQTKTLVIVK